jgi:PAS domain S-box-containing protein
MRKHDDKKSSLLTPELTRIADAVGISAVVDREGLIVHWSPSAESYYGWAASEVVGWPLRSLVGDVPSEGSVFHRHREGRPLAVVLRTAPLTEQFDLVCISDEGPLRMARAESELRRSQIERLLGTMSDGLVLVDLSGEIRSLNPNAERFLGCQADTLCGQSVSALTEFLGEEGHSIVEDARSGIPSSHILTLPSTGLLVEAKVYPAVEGVSIYFILSGAATAEAVCRDLFEASPDAQFLLDDNVVIECNLAAVRLLGMSAKSQLIGRNTSYFCPPVLHDGTLADARRREIALSLERKRAFHGNWTFQAASGRQVPVHLALCQVQIGGKLMEHVICHDLTDLHAVQSAAQEVEDRFRAIVENSNDVIYLLSSTGRLRFVNPSFSRIFGYTAEEVLGEQLMRFVHPEDRPRLRDQRNLTLRGESATQFEFRLRTRAGDYRYLSSTGSTIRSRTGALYFVGMGQDVTDRVRYVQAVAEARDAALASSRTKSEFLATVSHEVRTPLNGVIGAAEILQASPLGPDERELVDTIRGSGETLLRIIDDILEISKAQSGNLSINPAPTDVVAMIAEVLSLLRPRAQEAGIGLDYRWIGEDPPQLHVDSARLKQIVFNLVGNALKFTKVGRVSVTAEYGGGRLHVGVRDTGIGIDESALETIFQPFKQADGGIQREYGGTGLGLTICRELVHAMHGFIEVESQVGVGSLFTFDIPSEAVEEMDALPMSDAGEPQGLKVLVVEDNDVNRMVVTRMLGQLGCLVDAARSGEEALERLARDIPDIILMDVQMPGIDGLETTRRIRKLPKGNRVPIVALTANAFREDRDACFESGMDDFLAKPVRRNDLSRMLDTVFRRYQAAA